LTPRGNPQRIVFPGRIGKGAAADVEVRLKPQGFDALEADNVAWLDLPAGRPPWRFYCPVELDSFRHAARAA